MANVPSHNRTRRSHRRSYPAGTIPSRRTHGAGGYLGPITGAEEVYEQIGIDEAGQVTSGQIAPGAVQVAAFAEGVQPVLLVAGLPTLPDPAYPEDIIVFDISVTPRVLYKNEGDVWVKLIGPGDIQANSITAGQIAAGAVSTSELAVGARLVGEYQNEDVASPGVFVDDTGILIREGKLTLQDEFGSTVMEASGFAGTWKSFLHFGIYNGDFSAGVVGTVANGRTSALPYWTVSDDNVGGVLTYQSDKTIKFTWGATNDKKHIESDPVPVELDGQYMWQVMYRRNVAAGTLVLTSWIEWFDSSGSSLGTSTVDTKSHTTTGASYTSAIGGQWPPPAGAVTAALHIAAEETVAHSASNNIEVTSASLRWAARSVSYLLVESLQSLDVYTDKGQQIPDINNGGTATFSNRSCEWTTLGEVVVFKISFDVTANGSNVGTVTVTNTGLPPLRIGPMTFLGARSGVNAASLSARASNSGGEMTLNSLRVNTADQTVAAVTGASFVNGDSWTIQGSYLTDAL